MKKISIITICLNDKPGLQKTIDSVARQSFRDFEFTVIDGGSNDGSVELIKQNLTHISNWISEKDSGIFNAQNKGIKISAGEYLLFLNSGDYLADENVLQKFSAELRAADIVYGDMFIDKGEEKLVYGKMPDHIGWKQMLRDTLWHPASFIKRELFLKYGDYDEQYKIVSDYEFFVRVIIGKKVKLKHISKPVSVFNMSGVSSDPGQKQKLADERRQVQNKYFSPVHLFVFRLYRFIRKW